MTCHDAAELSHRDKTLALLRVADDPFRRTTFPGHITASAIVWRSKRQDILLIWHEKLSRWYQPGGHCEPDIDTSVEAAAIRELLEESELPLNAFATEQAEIFDLDVHPIPARGAEPAHWHHDVRFLIPFRDDAIAIDTPTRRWSSLVELSQRPDESLRRVAAKLSARV